MVGLKGRHEPHPLVGRRNTGRVALVEHRDRDFSGGLNHRAKTGRVRDDGGWD